MAQNTDHKEAKATVRWVYRKMDTMKDGSVPFSICITKQRKRSYVATGLTIDPKYWDEAKNTFRRSCPHQLKDEITDKLNALVAKYQRAAKELVDADEQHDVKAVANKAVAERKMLRSANLLTYMDERITVLTESRKLGNAKVYRNVRHQLSQFLNSKYEKEDIQLAKITPKFCNDFEAWERGKGNEDVYISLLFRTFRAVLNQAITDGLLKADSYPFARNVTEKHKFLVGKFDLDTQKRAISREDIRKIEAYEYVGKHTGKWARMENEAEQQRVIRAKHVFLFCFYCGGINFVDLAQLRWKNVIAIQGDTGQLESGRIVYTRQKTGGNFNVKLLEPALQLLNIYRPLTYTEPNEYVFEILDSSRHKTPIQIKNRLDKLLSQVNASLKIIGSAVNISVPLTTYVARHSFGTQLRRAGTPDAVISQAYQHGSENTTKIYLDSFGMDTVDSAYDALL